MLACLRHPCLPAVLEAGEIGGRPYLLMELVEGESLSSVFSRGPMPEAALVALARDMAGALSTVHRDGLVHRDVKPQNVIITPNGRAMLVDFGFATRAREGTESNEAAGTFLYSAPEQTGMLKRPVDGRADLYALGVMLFEGAAGRPPFVASDVAELLRQHAAFRPPDLGVLRPDLNPVLVALIGKLLAKDPDDRYQSGYGLLYDVESLAQLADAAREGRSILLGQEDARLASGQDVAFVGRATELGALSQLWVRSLERRGGVALVCGEAGSGKTRLMRELVRGARAVGALLLAGKSNPSEPIPFAPIRDALEEHLRQVRRLPPAERAEAESRIRRAAGDVGELIKGLSPGLTALLSDLPDHPGLAEAQDPFYGAVAHFLVRLAEQYPGATLLLDDVQWLDDATLQVLRRLSTLLQRAPLLVLCTARDDAGSRDGVKAFAEAMGAAVEVEVTLGPLQDAEVSKLISAHLGGGEVDATLVRAVVTRSQGLPFAVVEYVRALLDAGLLEPNWGAWKVDADELDRVQLPHDVIRLVLRRLAFLDERTRRVLTVAAVHGIRFVPGIVYQACGIATDEGLSVLAEALRARLVELEDSGTASFVHDRVREALLAGLSAEELREHHRVLAQALDAHGGEGAAHVYEVARHYALADNPVQARRRHETNLIAGLQALEDHANEEAQSFLDAARRASVELGMPPDPSLAAALGDACARSGRLAEAVDHYARALSTVEDPMRRAELRAQLAQVHLAAFDTRRAWEEISGGMRELGLPPPRSVVAQCWTLLWSWVTGWLMSVFGIGIGSATGDAAQRHRLLARLCDLGTHLAYFDVRNLLMLQMTFRPWPSTLRLGQGREYVHFLGNRGVVEAVLGRARRAERTSTRATVLAERTGDKVAIARSHLYAGIASHVSGDLARAETEHRRAIMTYGRWLDAGDYVNGCVDAAWSLLSRGYMREALDWIRLARQRAEPAIRDVALQGHPFPSFAGALLATLGRGTEGLADLERVRNMVEKAPSERWRWSVYLQNLVMFHLEQGELGAPLEEAITRHGQLGLDARLAPYHLRLFFVHQAYARLAQARIAPAVDRAHRMGQARAAVRELLGAASTPVLKAHALVAFAGLRRLEGHRNHALRLLARAERLSREHDIPWCAYEIFLERARMLQATGQVASAVREARLAQAIASNAGWESRVRRVQSEIRIPSSAASNAVTQRSAPPASVESLRMQRQLDALLEVSLACAVVFDPAEQARVALDAVVRIFGAERAFLFLVREDAGELELSAGRGAGGLDLPALEGYSRTVVDRVRHTHRPIVVTGSEEGEVLATESVLVNDIRSIMATPLLVQGRLIGVVYLDHRLARGVFGPEDELIFVAMANHISVAMETARAARLQLERKALERDLQAMQVQATTDPLTGLKNRRALDDQLRGAEARARRNRLPLSFMLLDIDHFKHVNDRYGHQVGDQVLTAVAQAILPCTRASDLVSRYGGEEFCLVLENTDLAGAAVLGERIRAAVSALEFHAGGATFQITVSAGIGQLDVHASTIDALMQATDAALYEAKRAGRNQVRAAA